MPNALPIRMSRVQGGSTCFCVRDTQADGILVTPRPPGSNAYAYTRQARDMSNPKRSNVGSTGDVRGHKHLKMSALMPRGASGSPLSGTPRSSARSGTHLGAGVYP